MTDTTELLDFHLQKRVKNRKPNRMMGTSRQASGLTNLADVGYRRAYIDVYAAAVNDPNLASLGKSGAMEDIEKHMDMWQVMEVTVDGEDRWVPHPLWDVLHGYLVRPSFASRGEAVAEIARVGGVLQGA